MTRRQRRSFPLATYTARLAKQQLDGTYPAYISFQAQQGDGAMRTSLVTVFALALMTLGACGTQGVPVNATEVVPGAKGWVKADMTTNRNAKVSLKVDRLANPADLSPSRRTYVVWARTPEGSTYQLGRLLVDRSGKAKLTAIVPAQRFRVMVTAENEIPPRSPGGPVVIQSPYLQAG
jgi:hypothetical protein